MKSKAELLNAAREQLNYWVRERRLAHMACDNVRYSVMEQFVRQYDELVGALESLHDAPRAVDVRAPRASTAGVVAWHGGAKPAAPCDELRS